MTDVRLDGVVERIDKITYALAVNYLSGGRELSAQKVEKLLTELGMLDNCVKATFEPQRRRLSGLEHTCYWLILAVVMIPIVSLTMQLAYHGVRALFFAMAYPVP